MRTLSSLILFTLLSQAGSPQGLPLDQDGRISYIEVVTLKDIPQGELYSRALLWYRSNFRAAEDVISRAVKEEGVIIARCSIPVTYKQLDGGSVLFTLTLECRDGRYRYQFTDFTHVLPTGGGWGPAEAMLAQDLPESRKRIAAEYLSQISDKAEEHIKSLKRAMVSASDIW